MGSPTMSQSRTTMPASPPRRDPFASLLDHDPFEAARQSTDKDYRWPLSSLRGSHAEAKYDDDQDDVVPLFTHARIAGKSPSRSVGIAAESNLDIVPMVDSTRRVRRPPKEVPKEEFELEEKLEELKKEAAEDLAADGSVDPELAAAHQANSSSQTLVERGACRARTAVGGKMVASGGFVRRRDLRGGAAVASRGTQATRERGTARIT